MLHLIPRPLHLFHESSILKANFAQRSALPFVSNEHPAQSYLFLPIGAAMAACRVSNAILSILVTPSSILSIGLTYFAPSYVQNKINISFFSVCSSNHLRYSDVQYKESKCDVICESKKIKTKLNRRKCISEHYDS